MKKKLSLLLLASLTSAGCATTNGFTGGTSGGVSTFASKFSDTGRAVKGQMGSVGTAMGSAYTKTKGMFASAVAGPSNTVDPSDPTSLSGSPPVIGAELYVLQGQSLEARGELDKAQEMYDKALAVDAKNYSAVLSLARLADRRKEDAKSLEYYAKAEAISPMQTEIYSESAQIHLRAGNLTAARQSLQKAVNLKPTDRSYRTQLAGVMVDQGATAEAMSELMQVDPPAMANYQMAYILAARKNTAGAQQHLQAALRIDPNLQPARDLMASLQSSGTAQQAYGTYQQATAAYQNIGTAYQQGQQVYQQANTLYQQGQQVYQQGAQAYQQGQQAVQQGQQAYQQGQQVYQAGSFAPAAPVTR